MALSTTNSSTHLKDSSYDVNREAKVLDAALAHDLKQNAIQKAKAQAQADVAQQLQALRGSQAATAAHTASVAADIKAKLHKSIQALSDMGNKLHQHKASRGIFEEDAQKLHQQVASAQDQ